MARSVNTRPQRGCRDPDMPGFQPWLPAAPSQQLAHASHHFTACHSVSPLMEPGTVSVAQLGVVLQREQPRHTLSATLLGTVSIGPSRTSAGSGGSERSAARWYSAPVARPTSVSTRSA